MPLGFQNNHKHHPFGVKGICLAIFENDPSPIFITPAPIDATFLP